MVTGPSRPPSRKIPSPGGPLVLLVAAVAFLALPMTARQTDDAKGWLDRPLTNWNSPGAELPKAPAAAGSRDDLLKRCGLMPKRSTAAERALADARWIPFLLFDRELIQDDIEILGGMTGADGMCRPAQYNAFVFVGGRFAGTLSPQLMTSQRDGSAVAIRIVPTETITVDFARYRVEDPACCPSSHLIVRFRIDRTGSASSVVPVNVRRTRG